MTSQPLLIRLARWFRRHQQVNPVQGKPQTFGCGQAHAKVSYYDSVTPNLAMDQHVPKGLQGDVGDAIGRTPEWLRAFCCNYDHVSLDVTVMNSHAAYRQTVRGRA